MLVQIGGQNLGGQHGLSLTDLANWLVPKPCK